MLLLTTIETNNRLLLRRIDPSDALPLFEGGFRQPEVVHFLEWLPHDSVEQTQELVAGWHAAWASGTRFMYSLIRKSDGAVVGCASLEPDNGCRMELGGLLTVDAREKGDKGLMREAWGVLIQQALLQPTIYSVWAVCDIDNERSEKAALAVGMRRIATISRYAVRPNLDPEPRSVHYFEITRT